MYTSNYMNNEKFSNSPCTGVCNIFKGICLGCFRTSLEISNWNYFGSNERNHFYQEIDNRKEIVNEALREK